MIFKQVTLVALWALTAFTNADAAGFWSTGSGNTTGSIETTATANIGAQVIPPFEISSSNQGPIIFTSDFFNNTELAGAGLKQTSRLLVLNPRLPMNTELTIAGEPETAFTLSLPSKGTINISDGRQALFLDGVLSSNQTTGLLDSLGQQTLTIQAIFSMLDDNKLEGHFSGNLPITIEHN